MLKGFEAKVSVLGALCAAQTQTMVLTLNRASVTGTEENPISVKANRLANSVAILTAHSPNPLRIFFQQGGTFHFLEQVILDWFSVVTFSPKSCFSFYTMTVTAMKCFRSLSAAGRPCSLGLHYPNEQDSSDADIPLAFSEPLQSRT